jgi:hypothetical protein
MGAKIEQQDMEPRSHKIGRQAGEVGLACAKAVADYDGGPPPLFYLTARSSLKEPTLKKDPVRARERNVFKPETIIGRRVLNGIPRRMTVED